MFYSQIILAKKGPLGKIWIAAHWDKKLNKAQIFQTNINTSVVNILQPTVPLALRVSGHLLLGLVRIYSRKVKYLVSDASEALVKFQMAFRPGTTDLPTGATVAAPGAIEAQGWYGEFDDMGMDVDVFSNAFAVDNWMEETRVKFARRADITLTDPAESMSMLSGQERDGSLTFDVGDLSWGNLSDSGVGGIERSRVSRVSDIEAVRDGDSSGMRSGRLSVSMDAMAEGGAGAAADKEDGQMEGYDDLGPPTHPGELALDADIGGGRELDDGAALEIGDGGFEGGPDFDEAPEFNADLGDFEQAGDVEMPGAVQLDDDTLNFDGTGFSRRESAGDFLTGGGAIDRSGLLGGEEEEEEEGGDGEEATKARAVPRVRKRKLVLNQVTLIDMPTMKAQLQDCSDITRKRRRGPRRVAAEVASTEERLSAPLMPWLAPALQEMLRACMTPGGLPFPVRMRPQPEAKEREEEEEQRQEEEEEIPAPDPMGGEIVVGDKTQEEIEITRRAEEQRLSMGGGVEAGAVDKSLGSAFQDGQEAPEMDKLGGVEGGDVDNFDLGGAGMELDAPELGVGEEGYGDEMNPQDEAGNRLDGSLDFGGGVNDLDASRDKNEQELQEEKGDASAMGGDGTGQPPAPISGILPRHKWHPHTVKVLRLVQKQLKTCRSPPGVTHASITRGSNRRTAAGAFFELLQLKTWDFVELSQEESYGDIKVTPGRCLNDEAQAAPAV